MAKVLVVDDHPLVREMVASIARDAGYVVFEAGDGEGAVEKASTVQPDLVVMDVSMPGISGIDATRRIVLRDPSVRVVMLSLADSAEVVREAVRAGAVGYLTKAVASRNTVVDALRRVSEGEMVFAPANLSDALTGDSAQVMTSDAAQLTAREREIIALAAQDASSSVIAAELGLSARTVENHLARIYKKLGINSRAQLARVAVGALSGEAAQDTRREPSRPEAGRTVTPAGVLVGRGREFELLTGKTRDLARGRGGLVLVEGEPGIGKTALVRGALSSAPHEGFQIFWGTCDELGQDIPLLPFVDALGVRRPSATVRRATIARLLRGEVGTDRGADVPAMLAEQLIALIVEETLDRPVVLVIDDLQWADHASVKLLGRLARTARQIPLLLVGLSRPTAQREDLLAVRRAINDDARLQLGPLPEPAVAEVVRIFAGGHPDRELLQLTAGAAGNPLYLTELLAALARAGGITVTSSGTAQLTTATVPSSLSAAIADRLNFVSASTRDVLRAAALLGVEFPVPDLAVVLGMGAADLLPPLEEALAMGVLTESGMVMAFRHPLMREALYAELPSPVRSTWHLDAGHALAAAGAPPAHVARQMLRAISPPDHVDDQGTGVGDTIASAGAVGPENEAGSPASGIPSEGQPAGHGSAQLTAQMDKWLLEWLAVSAESLVGQAPGVASELLSHAVASVSAGSFRHAWLASRLADALYRSGRWAEAEKVAERTLGHVTDPDLIVDLHWTLAQCRMLAGRSEELISALDRALATPGIADRHRARLLVLAARTSLVSGDVEIANAEAKRALGAAEKAGDGWAAGWSLHVQALAAIFRGLVADALPLYDRGLAVTETDPALTDLGLLLQVNKAATLINLDRCEEGLETAERARQVADRVGTTIRQAQAHGALGQALFEVGRWDDALNELAVMPEDLKEPFGIGCELGISAEILLHRNETSAARRCLADASLHAQRTGRTSQLRIAPLLLAQSLDRELAGAIDEAASILTAPFAGETDDLAEIEDLFADAVRLARKSGDTSTARAIARQAASFAEGSQIPHRQANALYCQGLIDGDPSVLLAAAQRFADARRPLPQAKALEAAAECLVEADERTTARQVFAQAVEVYEFLRAEADLNRVNAQFRAYGIRRGPHSKHRRAVSGWDSLTDTELKVAAFVKEGLSNPEIAARLILSPRTVGTHVSHILKKLNVSVRTDIARESALRALSGG